MKQNILLAILFLFIVNSSFSQIIFDKKNEYFGKIENFENKTIEFQCLNKYDIPIKVAIESISNNVEVKITQDTIQAKAISRLR